MRQSLVVLLIAVGSSFVAQAENPPTAASVKTQLAGLTLDPAASFQVRDIHLRRGDVSIYLNEGVLTFAEPIAGRRIAAVFTTEKSEAGDAEVILLPAQAAERASLASFASSPNLDEHFDLAVFFFSDDTASELLAQIADGAMSKAPPPAPEHMTGSLRARAQALMTSLARTVLDAHSTADGLFFATFMGRQLGAFDLFFQPAIPEPVTIGAETQDGFRIWTAYRPRHMQPFKRRPLRMEDYKIDGKIADDLALTVTADFRFTPDSACGRVIALELSPRLQVQSATVDGRAAGFLQQPGGASDSDAPENEDADMPLLLVTNEPLTPGRSYAVEVKYSGAVIRHVQGNLYFVGQRTSWFPHIVPLLTNFDITLHCPDRFRLVLTGEPISDSVSGNIRTMHSRTVAPSQLAGFNLGEYSLTTASARHYRLEIYSPASGSVRVNTIPEDTAHILNYYTQRWLPLPIHSIAVTPIPGYFGQGFPGLIYLSTISFLPEESRPSALRSVASDIFFSDLLLPHEIAHQWWGNLITPSDYRSAWLMEAMANYAALEYLESNGESAAFNRILAGYRHDLLELHKGKPAEEAGPVDFGVRILQNSGVRSWHTVVYGKGTWVLQMLRQRLGEAAFHQLERDTLETYSGKSITNEEFRSRAARVNPGGPDRALTKFFDTWVYGTGIPVLGLRKTADDYAVILKSVDEGFTVDVPLRCKSPGGAEGTRWVSLVTGENSFDTRKGETCQLPKESDFLYVPGS